VQGAAEPAVVGIDVGGTKVAAGRVSGARATDIAERPTDLSSPGALLDGIESAAREAIEPIGAVDAVGVGVPSQIDFASGTVVASVNIPLEGVSLREELEGRLGTRVYVDNDANCAALAEAQFTDDAPAESLVMLTLGTGVGGGVVIDGRIFRGSSGLGAELGHVVVDADGPECPGACPNRGCLEALASGSALVREAALRVGREPDTPLGRAMEEGVALTGPLVTEFAHDGDPVARGALTVIGRNLGVGLANLVNIFEPEVIVIGGGVIAAGEMLLEPAREEMHARALMPGRDEVRVEAAMFGAEAGMIGAALMAREEALAA
jgi:glucokinase